MKILALDPAAKCGWAWTDGCRLKYDVWSLQAGTDSHPGRRLEVLREKLYAAYRDLGFDRLAYEDAQLGSHNFTTQGLHAELRGIIKLVASELEVETVAVNPATLKSFACGNGRAKKHDMIRAAQVQLGIVTSDDNVADALFVLEYAKQPRPLATATKKTRRPARVGVKRAPRLF